MNCANFLEYNPKIYIIFWNTIRKSHAFCDYVYQNQTELYNLISSTILCELVCVPVCEPVCELVCEPVCELVCVVV